MNECARCGKQTDSYIKTVVPDWEGMIEEFDTVILDPMAKEYKYTTSKMYVHKECLSEMMEQTEFSMGCNFVESKKDD